MEHAEVPQELRPKIDEIRQWLRLPGMPADARTAARSLFELVIDDMALMPAVAEYFVSGDYDDEFTERLRETADFALHLAAAEAAKRQASIVAEQRVIKGSM